MSQAKDSDVETRAMQLAQDDHLEWIKRPSRPGEADTPNAATNDERDTYRQQARVEIDRQEPPAAQP